MPIVTGRYKNLDQTKRICTLCDMTDMGDEFHYLMKCPAFNPQRDKYIKPECIRSHTNENIKMKHIMKSKH